MRKLFLILACILLSVLPILAQHKPKAESGRVRDCGGGRISLSAIYKARVPGFQLNDSIVLPGCKLQVKQLITSYKDADERSWPALSTAYCANRDNWYELAPGSCPDAAPPPTCRHQHWLTKGDADPTAWLDEQRAVYLSRVQKLKLAATDCKEKDIDKVESAKIIEFYKQHYQHPTLLAGRGQVVFSCYDGNCPVGFTCTGGDCAPGGLLGETIVKVRNMNLQERLGREPSPGIAFQYEGMRQLSKYLEGNMQQFTIDGQAMMPPNEELATWREQYLVNLKLLKLQTNTYHSLLLEYQRTSDAPAMKDSRSLQTIGAEIGQLNALMRKSFRGLNSAYYGMMGASASATNFCGTVFATYHKWYCYYVVEVLNAIQVDK